MIFYKRLHILCMIEFFPKITVCMNSENLEANYTLAKYRWCLIWMLSQKRVNWWTSLTCDLFCILSCISLVFLKHVSVIQFCILSCFIDLNHVCKNWKQFLTGMTSYTCTKLYVHMHLLHVHWSAIVWSCIHTALFIFALY